MTLHWTDLLPDPVVITLDGVEVPRGRCVYACEDSGCVVVLVVGDEADELVEETRFGVVRILPLDRPDPFARAG